MDNLRKNPHLYEINTYVWLEELSTRLGRQIRLREVPDAEWDRLRLLGFDFIWLMGVWERSPESRREFQGDASSFGAFEKALPGWMPDDIVGSPYAVRSYIPDGRIGDWAALDAVRERLRARGMRLILDFVPNHVALDHPWTRTNPEFFIRGTQEDLDRNPAAFSTTGTPRGAQVLARGKDPYFPAWRDVAQLNLFHPGLRTTLLAELEKISQHCDGLRCDMAMLVLNDIFAKTWAGRLDSSPTPSNEFWAEARAHVPNLLLMAESYWDTEPRLLGLGFDFVYDKGFYDALRTNAVPEIRRRLQSPENYQSHLMRFLENHDEERAATAFGAERLRAMLVLMATAPGLRFYHQGQLDGRRIRFPASLGRAADEPADAKIAALYADMLRFTSDDVFHSGEWRLLESQPVSGNNNGNLIAFDWRSREAWKLIVVNLSGEISEARIQLGGLIDAGRQYAFNDELNRSRYLRPGDDLRSAGLYVRLDAFQAHLFTISVA